MLSPASMSFASIVATTALIFLIWHTYHYDRWRCLVYTKQDWFRTVMLQILVLSIACFVAYTWMELHILYDEYYVMLEGVTIPAPWQLWSASHLRLWRASLYVLCTGWFFLQAVHLEEFLYWGYLIHGIRASGGPRQSWVKSPFFKVWIGASLFTPAMIFGAAHIETKNVDMMRGYIFLVGSSMSLLLAGASLTLCLCFPSFIERVRKQGATHEVLERLYFFQEMNWLRTVFRTIYTLCFLTLSIDAMTTEKRVNKSKFWSEILFLSGNLALFIATCTSIIVLLPRNMNSESLPTKEANPRPMVAYRRPTLPSVALAAAAFSPPQFYELGDRLNVDREALEAGLMMNQPEFEMKHSPKYPPTEERDSDSERGLGMGAGYGQQEHLNDSVEFREPFASAGAGAGVSDETIGRIRRTRFSEMPSLPSVMARFKKSDAEGERRPEPPRVIVTTTVERG